MFMLLITKTHIDKLSVFLYSETYLEKIMKGVLKRALSFQTCPPHLSHQTLSLDFRRPQCFSYSLDPGGSFLLYKPKVS